MTVRMLTSGLLGVLADLLQTADRDPDAGLMGGILLHTGRGYHGSEPGQAEILGGISSDRYVAGHTYTWCTGQLPAPSWWSVRDARAVLTVFKAARGRDKANTHAVEIRSTGGEIEIREDPNLIDEGISLRFGEGDTYDYPAHTLYSLLDRDLPVTVWSEGRFVDSHPRHTVSPAQLVPFSKVAARRGELVQLYRSHQHVPVLVQIGETYRGVIGARRGADDDPRDDGQRPGADVNPPPLDDPRWRRTAQAPSDGEPAQQLLTLDVDPSDAADPDGGAPDAPAR